MAEGEDVPRELANELVHIEERPEHGVKVLQGLNKLRQNGVLCDVTLIAEGTRFSCHRIILVSCSDYFLSMFTSGMRECRQEEIELKGITAKGLKKAIEVVYTSTTTLEGDDIFDVIAAGTHLQITPVIEFCERNFLSGMNTTNFFDFINTAKLYNMQNALKQIDIFIAQHLMLIAKDNTLNLLTNDQMVSCLSGNKICLCEIDIFYITWKWLRMDSARLVYAPALMKFIRFPLINPADLVHQVQAVDLMMSNADLRQMVLAALNYHVVPHSQPLLQTSSTQLRFCVERLVSVGGREIHPNPCLHDELLVFDPKLSATSLQTRQEMTTLPSSLSHMQVVAFNNFLYILGGCTTQCAHGESAVNSVLRYDPRFDTWFQVCPMLNKRAYFFAGSLGNKLYAVGGKFKDGSLATAECYDMSDNSWQLIASMPMSYHAHAGTTYGSHIYVSGGYSGNHFTPDLQRFNPRLNAWEDMAPMVTARGWHVMCTCRDKIYIFGGCNLNMNQQAQPVLQSECYDPATDQWTGITALSISHKEASCVVYRDSIYVLGGYNVQSKTGQKLVSKYDTHAGTWETVGALPRSLTGVGYCLIKFPSCDHDDLAISGALDRDEAAVSSE